MHHLKLFVELTRMNKPIGFMLLFWPCSWGLAYAYKANQNFDQFIFYLILFFLGSVLMRSAGCIINDILDRKFDKEVSRTKDRPIASGKITINLGLFYSTLLCLFAFFVLINFNLFTIILAIASMPLAFTYPLMKRYTYWPQLFLGITFNYGLILGWTSVKGEIDIIPIILYLGAIFWTLGYDTIYGFQDIEDDEIIGVKSTSIKFKESPKIFLTICYLIFILVLVITGTKLALNKIFFLGVFLIMMHLFFFQVFRLNKSDKNQCLNIFKSNNFLGLLTSISIILGKVL